MAYHFDRKGSVKFAITKTTSIGVPYLFLQELYGCFVLTTKINEAKLFNSREEAQKHYTEYVLPSVLMGDNPLEILNSISEISVAYSVGMDHSLNKKGIKE